MIIEEMFNNLIDLPCWNVQWDVDLDLEMNFGEPYLSINEPKPVALDIVGTSKDRSHIRDVSIKSKWKLWIFKAYWELSLYNFETVRKSSDYLLMYKALKRLEGQKIIKTTIQPKTLNTVWDFDLGGRLSVRRKRFNNDDFVWMLCCPDNHYLSVNANGTYLYE
jgi:hypothetical protein